jgi:hypothetical protein
MPDTVRRSTIQRRGLRSLRRRPLSHDRGARRRVAVASALLVAGAIATSATALATTDDGAAPPAAKPSFIGDKQFRHHGGCHHGDRGRSQQDSSLRY